MPLALNESNNTVVKVLGQRVELGDDRSMTEVGTWGLDVDIRKFYPIAKTSLGIVGEMCASE